jgi:hypothetical protein
MAQAIAADLLAILDENAEALETWAYLRMCVMLQRLYHTHPPPPAQPVIQYRWVGYGASARQLCEDYDRLTASHNQLKRRQKSARKRWRETEAALRQQVDELLTEIQYLEQRASQSATPGTSAATSASV